MNPDLQHERPSHTRLTSLIDCACIALRAGRPADARALLDRASSQFWAAHDGSKASQRHRLRPDVSGSYFSRN